MLGAACSMVRGCHTTLVDVYVCRNCEQYEDCNACVQIVTIVVDNSEFYAQIPTPFSLNQRQRFLQDGLQLLSHLHVYRDAVYRCHCLPEWKGEANISVCEMKYHQHWLSDADITYVTLLASTYYDMFQCFNYVQNNADPFSDNNCTNTWETGEKWDIF